jgi:hypothetical protein
MSYFPTISALTALPIMAAVWAAVTYPATQPYVTMKGSDVHEVIWLWRVPAYMDHPAWRIRWTWRDGMKARAYCYNPEEAAAFRAAHPDQIFFTVPRT